MPVDLPKITRRIEQLIAWRVPEDGNGHAESAPDEQPLRAELFSVDQLERHSKGLAGWHQLASGRAPDKLIPRLDENERVLLESYDLITAAVAKNRRIAPAAEWLLDNFYLIEEQIRTARRHLPRSYSRELPRLANGPAAGYPRVYGIALELIAHVDGRVDAVSLGGFIGSYQTLKPLTIGELWAVPIMLRLALIENLRRVASRIAAGRRDRDLADDWADRMVRTVEQAPTDLILVLADMARANPPLSSAFLAELTRHLHGQSPYFAFANSWLEHRVSEQGRTIEQLVQAESQAQASDQVSIGNSIISLRFLSSTDWKEFVESQSVVEQALRGDPPGVYAQMEFATRDRYRHGIEEIAKRSRHSEFEVARKAIQLAEAAAADQPQDRTAHVGYFLVDKGRTALERMADVRLSPRAILGKVVSRHPLFFYLSGALLIAAIVTAVFASTARRYGVPAGWVAALLLPVVLCAGNLSIAILNWLVTLFVTPRPLPRMDFRQGIPPGHRTMVVVPTMLSTAEAIDDLLDGLEVRYLANRDDNLHFALLTDFQDAAEETIPGDEELLRLAREGVEALNRKYESVRQDLFFLFHRPRKFNEREGVWMGWERKRGKLGEFNAVLRGGPHNRFSEIVGDTTVLPEVRYVITLDTDTQLPRDSACELVGAMAHPLNRPVFDPHRGRVVDGYGILQPRVGVSLPSATRSWFVRLFAGDPGIDPYTRVVSDVYQDLFGEGSFIGKGIYDVDTFEQACSAFPENAVLSHDLLESAHARSALISDVELYEEHPSRYTADVSRRHRWIRGDWQIGWWLLPRVPGADASLIQNPISGLSWWKIFDNLRRSLVPPAMLALLLCGWLLPWPGLATAVTLFVVTVVVAAPLMALLLDVFQKPDDLPVSLHLRAVAANAARQAGLALFTLVFLPYDAYMSLDAVARTIVRVLWTRRKLLEWRTASDVERAADNRLFGFFRAMWFEPVLAVVTLAIVALFRHGNVAAAAPLAAPWVIAPALAWWLSRSLTAREPRLHASQRLFLEKLSRRTWRYFEVFCGPEDNWLAPDNFQEHPAPVIAPRTSPTNIGVALLANLAARDFGYISTGRLVDRTDKTLATLGRLERYRGHLYNWYDTRSLTPLTPLYVSSVDSGNLAGHLLVLRRGLMELTDTPVLSERTFSGLAGTVRVMLEVGRGVDRAGGDGTAAEANHGPQVPIDLLRKAERIELELTHGPTTLTASALFLQRLAASAAELAAAPGPDGEFRWWARALERESIDHRDDLVLLVPWALLPPPPEGIWREGPSDNLHRRHALREWLGRLEGVPTLREIAGLQQTVLPAIDDVLGGIGAIDASSRTWFDQLRKAIVEASRRAAQRIHQLEEAAERVREFEDMDLDFLFDRSRELFSIGYNVSDHRLDAGYYDLLASEARLASFVAISQGQLGQEHWFALGRLLTTSGGAPALLSWSGSMFEYLMPLLVMPTYENTLLDRTYKAVVRRQIDYGRQRGVPWGISESGYNATDVQLNYQYRAFGVPGLGLKRGLAEDLVIAPYATVMSLMVEPEAAMRNLERLAADGRLGIYGFYEAIDYTPSRLPRGATSVTIRSFMAHHQGMSLLSLAYLLLDRPMQRRFISDPMLRANDLLLQERVPRAAAPVFPHATEASATRVSSAEAEGTMRVFTDPSGPTPEVHLLSNGRYHVMVSSAGGGYSRWRDLAITRWREDATRDCWGSFCYLRDLESGKYWSTSYQPTQKPSKRYEAIFTQARAEFRRRDEEIDTHVEISVSPEDDVEIRRVTLTNRSGVPRTIEVTSYAEVVLAPAAHDAAHPAFSNLFVQTELVRERQAVFCTRRPRSATDRPPWMVHLMTVQGTAVGEASFETDRLKFVGRNRTPAAPLALEGAGALTDSHGPVLDPIVCVRRVIRLQPDETARVDVVNCIAETREAAALLMEKYHDPRLTDRVFEMAWTHSQVVLRQLNATEADAQVYGRLAGSVIYATGLRRAAPSVLVRNRRGQSGLWGYGISGDLPIMLVRIRDAAKLELVAAAVQAHAYWRMKGLTVDLVIWNEDDSIYRQNLYDRIMGLIAASPEAALVDKPGGVFVRRGEQMSEEDRVLMQTVARVVVRDEAGTLAEQVERRGRIDAPIAPFRPLRRRPDTPTAAEVPQRDLVFFNGLGGFTRDGREYITVLSPGQNTPAPWSNVIANPDFGTVVSESGSIYTWAENSHEFRITPWPNDSVSGAGSEALYIRDEESGRVWSPSPLPVRGAMPYVIRHGFGYSVFEYAEDGIVSELTLYVANDAPVKFARLKIANRSGRARRLSVTAFWELTLGELSEKTAMHLVSENDPLTGALLVRNAYSQEFANRVVFFDSSEQTRTITADRTEFLGRNGSAANPAALRRARLSGRVGAGIDPCAAMQVALSLDDGQERDVVFTMGSAASDDQARQLLLRFRGAASAQQALERVWQYWGRTLGVVYVETPDAGLNFLANGWLEYQVLSCRMWARTGFYQSGGAFGFRDQLQDAMALLHAEPRLLREHLLRAAAHQFREGDVQHWWHPPVGRGVRTHFSDDYLWLPYATCRYVIATGDTGVLDERVPFLEGRPVRPEEEAYYDLPHVSEDKATLYDHCVRAIENGLRFGAHGLPLMGCGDWNDGMNLVGEHGKGESVWLAFFLYDVLTRFADLARPRGDAAFADKCLAEAGALRLHVEDSAWDGKWYRRAYFDNGEPLGSAESPECQIDSLPQSWAILSGAGERGRAQLAMESVDERLVRRDARLIQLFDPPFDKSHLNPGYIKGYVPGVRENGGQYTHAAVWTVMAFAAMGDRERAWELFDLISPLSHGATRKDAQVYKVEPYVVAADVYAVPPHTGRGGWTWYTGSAGWMYRLITESLLGLQVEVDTLRFTPCLPASWTTFRIHYRYRETFFHITIRNSGAGKFVRRVVSDGVAQPDKTVRLVDDRKPHEVEVEIE